MPLLSACLSTFGVTANNLGHQPWEFHAYIEDKAVVSANPCSMCALHLPVVLTQVFAFLDTSTLCTAVPFVCKQWHEAAKSPLLWAPHIDQAVLTTAQHLAEQAATAAQCSTRNNATPSTLGAPINLALLYHAVYARNLLRNPSFIAAQNATRINSSFGKTSKQGAVISAEQRKLAWVSTVGDPHASMWQCPPVGLPCNASPPPPPLPYPTYHSSSSGFAQQLQSWMRRCKAAGSFPASPSRGGNSNTAAEVSCLATEGGWREVVQVVDLLEELTLRGLDMQLATSLLDSGSLALAFSVYVAAAEVHNCNAPVPGTTSLPLTPWGGEETSGTVAQPQFAVAVMLDDGQVPLRSFQTFVKRESSHHFFSKKLAVAPGSWRRYAYAMPATPAGCRRAVILLRGRGGLHTTQHCGPGGVKFASAQLSFIRHTDIDAFGAEQCMADWADKQVVGL